MLTEIAVMRQHGKSYLVDWNENRASCVGRLTKTDGSVYVGMWVGGLRHGYGTLLIPNTGFYSGEVSASEGRNTCRPLLLLFVASCGFGPFGLGCVC